MKTRIKNYLIHFLGGYTKEEYKIPSLKTYTNAHNKGYEEGFAIGKKWLANVLNQISDNNNGCSKQEWIDLIYSEIQKYR